MGRKPKQRRSILLKLFMLAACVYLVFTLWNQYSGLVEAETEKEAYLLEVKQLVESNKYLESVLKDESNKSIIEKAARERLGYIYSDEQIFVDISGN